MSNLTELLGNQIRKKLDEMNRRPAWLAKESGIDPASIGRIISGETSPNIETVEKIAAAFDCSIGELVENRPPPADKEKDVLIEHLQRERDEAIARAALLTGGNASAQRHELFVEIARLPEKDVSFWLGKLRAGDRGFRVGSGNQRKDGSSN